jgi:hypothetical protein
VQQSFYDAIQGVHFTAPAISGIVETSLMCDVSEMALLSHIPAIADRALLLDHPEKLSATECWITRKRPLGCSPT